MAARADLPADLGERRRLLAQVLPRLNATSIAPADASVAEAAATITRDDFPRAPPASAPSPRWRSSRRPAYKLWIDLGPDLGVRKSSAQVTARYTPAELVGRQAVAVVNLPR